MPLRVVLTDGSVNDYGFRLDVSGYMPERFEKNPIMLFQHSKEVLPIGTWTDITVEDGKILATPVFDEADPFAVEVKGKVERGIIKAVSVGFEPLEVSEADKMPGQAGPTVTKFVLKEASWVAVPANPNALVVPAAEGIASTILEMKAYDQNGVVFELSSGAFKKFTQPFNKMDKIKAKLGLAAAATEEDIVLALDNLHKELSGLKSDREAHLQQVVEEAGLSKELASNVLEVAKFNTQLAFNMVKELSGKSQTKLETTKPAEGQDGKSNVSLEAIIKTLSSGASKPEDGDDRSSWNYRKWETEDPKGLSKMKNSEPERFQKLLSAQYMKA